MKTCSRELKAKDDMITSKCKYLENRCKELNSQAKNSKERREETSIQLNKIYKNYNIKIKDNNKFNCLLFKNWNTSIYECISSHKGYLKREKAKIIELEKD